jgi:arylsulfatase A-like enzyme
LRSAQAGYYGLINHIDDQLYWLIQELRIASWHQKRPWLIVFTADHGDMLGDHYTMRKCEPYEGSSRIPFVVAGSEELGFKAGQRCSQPICLEDLMPTFLELAGVTRPQDIDGKSLVGALRGEERSIRSWLHAEHAPCYSEMQAYQMLTDGRAKYIWRPQDGTEQLFDLERDPRELHDLSTCVDREQELALWRSRMVHSLRGRPEGFVDGDRLVAGRPFDQVLPHAR